MTLSNSKESSSGDRLAVPPGQLVLSLSFLICVCGPPLAGRGGLEVVQAGPHHSAWRPSLLPLPCFRFPTWSSAPGEEGLWSHHLTYGAQHRPESWAPQYKCGQPISHPSVYSVANHKAHSRSRPRWACWLDSPTSSGAAPRMRGPSPDLGNPDGHTTTLVVPPMAPV